MTVQTSSPRVVYDGDGITTVFAIPFKFLDNSHISAFLRDAVPVQNDWVEGTQYTITGAGNPAGGTLTIKTTPTDYTPQNGEQLIILRIVPDTQQSQYVEGDDLPSATLENDLDKRTMASQQIAETLARSLTAPIADTVAGNFELPLDADRASKFLAFDALGNPIPSLGTAAGQPVPFSTFGQDWVTLADDAAARTFLDAQRNLLSLLTADGDIVIRSGGAIVRLAKANDGDGLVLASGIPAWAAAPTAGDCRLTKSGANLLLSRLGGRALTINNKPEAIPAAGVLLAAAGLSAGTTYFIYAFMSGGTMTLEASTTAHIPDTTTGIEIKTGDATRTLVGMARPGAGPVWVDTPAQRFVVSYFNRRGIAGLAHFTTDRITASTTYVELNAEIRNEFLTWADEVVQARFNGSASADTIADVKSSIGIDGATAEDVLTRSVSAVGTYNQPVAVTLFKSGLAEGYHYATGLGSVAAGNGTWTGGATAGDRCTVGTIIRG